MTTEPPPGWPAPRGPEYAAVPQQDGTAVAALVLAIASFVICPLVSAIVALVLAHQSQQRIEASGGRLTGEGLNTAARLIAWIHLGLLAFAVLLIVVLAAAAS